MPLLRRMKIHLVFINRLQEFLLSFPCKLLLMFTLMKKSFTLITNIPTILAKRRNDF